MRSISALMMSELFKSNSGVKVLILVTMTHPTVPGVLRICNEATTRLTDQPLRYGTISNGNTFQYVPFDILLPDDMDKKATSSQLIVSNLSQDLVDNFRLYRGPGNVTIQLALSSTPNVIEIQWVNMNIRGVSGTIQLLTVDFGINSMEREPYPADKFTPSGFPAVFGITIT